MPYELSIIIPCYNQKYLIYQLLKSLETQDYPLDQFEVILADDGSEDGTDEMVERPEHILCL